MRIVKQAKEIVVKNIDEELPKTIRALIVGPSNCGKTNVMISLIKSPNGLIVFPHWVVLMQKLVLTLKP